VQFACKACGHPAVSLPDHLHEDAVVRCRRCHSPIATWAVFKRRTTQAILSSAVPGDPAAALSPDPLDQAVLEKRHAFVTWA
jgi:DNA-directed RNA polymerase subunit RPC12/RpoP